jgi:hypothetical protein
MFIILQAVVWFLFGRERAFLLHFRLRDAGKAEMFVALIYLVGINTGAPLSFTQNTMNFAGFVWLAFRPTT